PPVDRCTALRRRSLPSPAAWRQVELRGRADRGAVTSACRERLQRAYRRERSVAVGRGRAGCLVRAEGQGREDGAPDLLPASGRERSAPELCEDEPVEDVPPRRPHERPSNLRALLVHRERDREEKRGPVRRLDEQHGVPVLVLVVEPHDELLLGGSL